MWAWPGGAPWRSEAGPGRGPGPASGPGPAEESLTAARSRSARGPYLGEESWHRETRPRAGLHGGARQLRGGKRRSCQTQSQNSIHTCEKEGPQHDKNVKGVFSWIQTATVGQAAELLTPPSAPTLACRSGGPEAEGLVCSQHRLPGVAKFTRQQVSGRRSFVAGASDPSPALEQVSPPPSPWAGLGPGRQQPTCPGLPACSPVRPRHSFQNRTTLGWGGGGQFCAHEDLRRPPQRHKDTEDRSHFTVLQLRHWKPNPSGQVWR